MDQIARAGGSVLECQFLGVGGHGFESWPNPRSDLLSISLLISETLNINNFKGGLGHPVS